MLYTRGEENLREPPAEFRLRNFRIFLSEGGLMKSIKIAGFLVLFLAGNLSLTAAIPASERQALIDLYNSTNGDAWTNNSGWKTAPLHTDGFALPGTENTWFGVTTDAGNSSVQQLSLGKTNMPTGNNLVGTIPVSLGNLINLTGLSLDNNHLTGSIPSSLGNLSKLITLFLYSNQLTGSIPKEIGNLNNLLSLLLFSNQLTGSIPKEIGNLSKLRYLNLAENQLAGTLPLELGNLSALITLFLNSNQFMGDIPSSLFQPTYRQHSVKPRQSDQPATVVSRF
jgi:hypothetical protein